MVAWIGELKTTQELSSNRMSTDDELLSRIPALQSICDGYIIHLTENRRLLLCVMCVFSVCVLCVLFFCVFVCFGGFVCFVLFWVFVFFGGGYGAVTGRLRGGAPVCTVNVVHAMESLFVQSKRNLHSTHACKSGSAALTLAWELRIP